MYFAFLAYFIATDKPHLMTVLVPKPYIPVPDMTFSSAFNFSMKCQFQYLGKYKLNNLAYIHRLSTDEDTNLCAKYINATQCSTETDENRFDGRCTGQFDTRNWLSAPQNMLNYTIVPSQTKFYAISFTFYRTPNDTGYNASSDTGMKVRVVESTFNPMRINDHLKGLIKWIDEFYAERLNNLNLHVLSSQQLNQMYISRKQRYYQIPSFLNVIGIPPVYFKAPFIDSTFESVKIPSITFNNVSSTDLLLGDIYGILFIGNNNWMEEIQTESRSISILNALALFAAFYGLLMGIYVCLFGFIAVTPWGICQRTCCRRRSKEKLYRRFAPGGIPLISQSRVHKTIPERIDAVENFIKLFLLNVDDYADPEPETTVPETKPSSSKLSYIGGGSIGDEEKVPRRRVNNPVSFADSMSSANTLVGAPPDGEQTISNIKPSEGIMLSPNNPPLHSIEEEITSEPSQTTINRERKLSDSDISSITTVGASPDDYQTITNVKPSGNMTLSPNNTPNKTSLHPIKEEITSEPTTQVTIDRKISDSNISSSHSITSIIYVDQNNNELDRIESDRHSNMSTERRTIHLENIDDDVDPNSIPRSGGLIVPNGRQRRSSSVSTTTYIDNYIDDVDQNAFPGSGGLLVPGGRQRRLSSVSTTTVVSHVSRVSRVIVHDGDSVVEHVGELGD
ncbi:2209_t:CDS:2, partial [Gigaspora margarita]